MCPLLLRLSAVVYLLLPANISTQLSSDLQNPSRPHWATSFAAASCNAPSDHNRRGDNKHVLRKQRVVETLPAQLMSQQVQDRLRGPCHVTEINISQVASGRYPKQASALLFNDPAPWLCTYLPPNTHSLSSILCNIMEASVAEASRVLHKYGGFRTESEGP